MPMEAPSKEYLSCRTQSTIEIDSPQGPRQALTQHTCNFPLPKNIESSISPPLRPDCSASLCRFPDQCKFVLISDSFQVHMRSPNLPCLNPQGYTHLSRLTRRHCPIPNILSFPEKPRLLLMPHLFQYPPSR